MAKVMPNVESIPTDAIAIPYKPILTLSAVSMLVISKPVAERNAISIAKTIVNTGIEVDINPVPIPEIITVAGPVFVLSAILIVGL